MTKKIETRTLYLSFDGTLLISELKDEMDIEEEDIFENQKAARELTGDQYYVSLVISAPYTTVTHEGRKAVSRAGGYTHTLAQAIVVRNLANKIMGNFMLKFHHPPCPCRLFNERETAIEWLYTFVNNEGENKDQSSGKMLSF